MGDIFKNLRQIIGFSKRKPVFPQALLIGLHGPGQGPGGGDGVHPQLVQLIVPAADFLQIGVFDVAAQKSQRLQLRPLDSFAVHAYPT